MAGIGFELKRLFSQKGLLLQLRANLYASLVISGPMLLGVALLFSMKYLSGLAGASGAEQDAMIVITAYSLLFSLLTSVVTFALARYVADMLYCKQPYRILPARATGEECDSPPCR